MGSEPRREASVEEFRAMAHPLRLRILRLCLHQPRTNKELADALGIEPATCLHHVRMLRDTGFLVQEDPRPGPRGSTEKPYRSTGKSWYVEAPTAALEGEAWLASLDALRAELVDTGVQSVKEMARLGLKLSPVRAKELEDRLRALIYEYAEADADEGGDEYGLFVVLHGLDADRSPR